MTQRFERKTFIFVRRVVAVGVERYLCGNGDYVVGKARRVVDAFRFRDVGDARIFARAWKGSRVVSITTWREPAFASLCALDVDWRSDALRARCWLWANLPTATEESVYQSLRALEATLALGGIEAVARLIKGVPSGRRERIR